MRGAFRDRQESRGGVRWTRQRQARTKRWLGMPGPALTGSAGIYGPAGSEALTTTLRDAAGVEIRLVASPLRAGPSRAVPTPHAGVKGAGRARVSDRSERHPLKRPTVKL